MLEWIIANALGIATAILAALTLFLAMRNEIKNLANGHKQIRADIGSLKGSIERHQDEDKDEFALVRREIGEAISAIRSKVTEVELYTRDTFMRRDSGYKMQEALQQDFRILGDKIDGRLERMENKIDTKT